MHNYNYLYQFSKRTISCGVLLLISFVAVVVLNTNNTYAAGGTGSDGGEGGKCTNASTNNGSRDCCMGDGGFGGDCPHWIKGGGETFYGIYQSSGYHTANNDKNADLCRESKEVAWVGRDGGEVNVIDNFVYSGHEGRKDNIDSFQPAHRHFHWGDPMDMYSQAKSWVQQTCGADDYSFSFIRRCVANQLGLGENDQALIFFCPEMFGSSGGIISKSVAEASSDQGSAKADTGFQVNETADDEIEISTAESSVNVQIKFKHFLKINNGTPPMATNYEAKLTVTGGGLNINKRANPKKDNFKLTQTNHEYAAFSPATHTVTAHIPQDSNTNYRICERIIYTYNSKNGKVEKPNQTQYTEACITIKTSDEVSDLCKRSNTAFYGASGAYYNNNHNHIEGNDDGDTADSSFSGQNGAISRVSDPDTEKLVTDTFAKPDDELYFFHCYYPDAYRVRKISDGTIVPGAEDNTCDIVANPSEYLFEPLESYALNGGSGSCEDGGPKNQEKNPIATYSPDSSDPHDVNGDPGDELGISYEQHVDYQTDEVEVTWTDTFHKVCEEDEETGEEDCTEWTTHDNENVGSVDTSPAESEPATVIVPFNFDTEISLQAYGTEAGGVVFPGGYLTVNASASIVSANNDDRGEEYATATPEGSEVSIVQFILPPSTPGDGLNLSGGIGSSPSDFAGSLGAIDTEEETLASGVFNEDNDDESVVGSWERHAQVPDVEDGTKLCVVVGIFPADSHGQPDDDKSGSTTDLSSRGMINSAALNEGGNWRLSNVVCRTIAKKPSFQTWSGGVYSKKGVTTSITDKCVGIEDLSWDTTCQNGDRTVFGSWSEYEAISPAIIVDFASGAGFGYSSRPSYDGSGGRTGGIASSNYNINYNYSHLTISNMGSRLGNSGFSVNSSTLLTRLLSKYPAGGDGVISNSDECNHIGGINENSQNGKVIVYRCPAGATITGDILVGHDDDYTAIDQIPQVIIIAKNININSNVSEVDAWLVATTSSSSANGTVNTCSQFSSGSTDSSGDCSAPLTIAGPVIAKTVKFNRTYGAGPGDDSIEPAERFILRPDAYLWAYSQAEDKEQAFTTYIRELAPRY